MKKYILITALIITALLSTKTLSYDNVPEHLRNLNGINGNPNEETLFIVDFSSSMNEKMGYTQKIYLTIDAIEQILQKSGNEMKIGLRIFGDSDKVRQMLRPDNIHALKDIVCTASELVLPIARFNAQNVSQKLSYRNPRGATPIGYSLRQAVQNDFSSGPHLKHIILVTDGEENCGDDPCAYIRQLSATRKDIKIDVIAIAIEPDSLWQSECIASATKGNLYTVNSPEDFKIKFQQAFNSVLTPQINTIQTPPLINQINTNDFNNDVKYKTYGFQFEY